MLVKTNWITCSIVLGFSFACSTGSGSPPKSHRDDGGAAGGGAGATDGGGRSGASTGGTGTDTTSSTAPPACGTFHALADGTYDSAVLKGVINPNSNAESRIALYDAKDGAPVCAKGEIVAPTAGGWGWALLDLTANAVLRPHTDPASGTSVPWRVSASYVPGGDGLLLDLDNLGGSELRLCLQDVSFYQFCANLPESGTLLSWSRFADQNGSGRYYNHEPLISLQITVPGNVGPFDFCLNSLVEAADYCACPGGSCECPSGLDACDGTCVPSVRANPNHCGSCDHSCASTEACSAGSCIKSTLSSLTLAFGMAKDTDFFYVATGEGGTVEKVSLTGGGSEVLAQNQAFPAKVTTANSSVYWLNAGTEAKSYTDGAVMTVQGGTVTTLASGQNNPKSLVTNSSHVYWANAGTRDLGYVDGAIMRIALSPGATPEVIADGRTHPSDLAIEAGALYWAEQGSSDWGHAAADGKVMKWVFSSGTLEPLAEFLRSPVSITVDAESVYLGTTDSIYRIPKSGGTAVPVAIHQGRPSSLRVDGENLYFTNYFDGSVMRAPLTGDLAPVTLARGQNYAVDLVVDSQQLYWVAQDGAGFGSVLTIGK